MGSREKIFNWVLVGKSLSHRQRNFKDLYKSTNKSSQKLRATAWKLVFNEQADTDALEDTTVQRTKKSVVGNLRQVRDQVGYNAKRYNGEQASIDKFPTEEL